MKFSKSQMQEKHHLDYTTFFIWRLIRRQQSPNILTYISKVYSEMLTLSHLLGYHIHNKVLTGLDSFNNFNCNLYFSLLFKQYKATSEYDLHWKRILHSTLTSHVFHFRDLIPTKCELEFHQEFQHTQGQWQGVIFDHSSPQGSSKCPLKCCYHDMVSPRIPF